MWKGFLFPLGCIASAGAVLLTPVMRKMAGPRASHDLVTVRMDSGSCPLWANFLICSTMTRYLEPQEPGNDRVF